MARTKQCARPATGSKAPRKEQVEAKPKAKNKPVLNEEDSVDTVVKLYTTEELKTLDLKTLKKHIQALEDAGYSISYDDIIIASAQYRDDEELLKKFLRKKIRHVTKPAGDEVKELTENMGEMMIEDTEPVVASPQKVKKIKPAKSEIAPEDVERYNELDKMPLRSKHNEPDLRAIAKDKVKGYTSMDKHETILGIIAAEKAGIIKRPKSVGVPKGSPTKASPVKASPVQDSQSKGSSSKGSPAKGSSTKTVFQPTPKPVSKPSPTKLPSSPKIEFVPAPPRTEQKEGKECGKYTYNELLDKRIDELQGILEKNGIADASGVKTVQQGADLVCQLSQNNEQCDASNDYECSDGLVCDINTKPGVCVDKGVASNSVDWLEYNGKQIVGNKDAIKALRKELGVKKAVVDLDDLEREDLVDRAVLISGRQPEEFNKLSIQQLTDMIEGYGIEEKRLRHRIKGEHPELKSSVKTMSLQQLRNKASILRGAQSARNRSEMIETLAAWTGEDPEVFEGYTTEQLNQRMEAMKYYELKPNEVAERKSLIKQIIKKTGTDKKSAYAMYMNWPPQALRQRLESLEYELGAEEADEEAEVTREEDELVRAMEEVKLDTIAEEDEQQVRQARKKQEKIKVEDIQKVLSDVMSGKKGQIEEFSQIQNTVLKCLGLVSA